MSSSTVCLNQGVTGVTFKNTWMTGRKVPSKYNDQPKCIHEFVDRLEYLASQVSSYPTPVTQISYKLPSSIAEEIETTPKAVAALKRIVNEGELSFVVNYNDANGKKQMKIMEPSDNPVFINMSET